MDHRNSQGSAGGTPMSPLSASSHSSGASFSSSHHHGGGASTGSVAAGNAKSRAPFKCFSDASQFRLLQFGFRPPNQLPYDFLLAENYASDRCNCQGGSEVILQEDSVLNCVVSLKVSAPVEYAWMVSKEIKNNVNTSDRPVIHGVPLGSFQPRDEPYQIAYQFKYPIIREASGRASGNGKKIKRTEGVQVRPSHLSAEEQHHIALSHFPSSSTDLPVPSSAPSTSPHFTRKNSAKTSLGSGQVPGIAAGLVGLTIPLVGTGMSRAGLPSPGLSATSASSVSSGSFSGTTTQLHINDSTGGHSMNVTSALFNLLFEQSSFDAGDDDDELTESFSGEAGGKSKKGILSAMKSKIARKMSAVGSRGSHTDEAQATSVDSHERHSQSSPYSPSLPTFSGLSNRRFFGDGMDTSGPSVDAGDDDSASVSDRDPEEDEESIPELETNEHGELANVYRSAPIYISKKMYKKYKQDGQLELTQKFYIIEISGHVLAKMSLNFVVTNLELPPMCSNCKLLYQQRVADRAHHSSSTTRHKHKTADKEALLFLASPDWKRFVFEKLRQRDTLQITPYKGLAEMQDRMFNRELEASEPASGLDRDGSESISSSTSHRASTFDLPKNIRTGKFVNRADFEDILTRLKKLESDAASLRFLESRDGIKLSYRLFPAKTSEPKANIVIAGHFGLGADWCREFADRLSSNISANIYLLYMRGHGESGGERGDAPSKESIWKDVRSIIRFIRWNDPMTPIVLGGHGGGAALCLNYVNWKRHEPANAYFFISPFLRELMRKHKRNMTKKDRFQMVLNQASGGILAGHWTAISLKNFAEEDMVAGLNVPERITVNVLASVLVHDAKEGFAALSRPFALYVGANDEIFPPEDVIGVAKHSPVSNKVLEVVEGQTHLGILHMVDEPIAEWLRSLLPSLKHQIELDRQRDSLSLSSTASNTSLSDGEND